jgi:beta-galactosidase/beta-glucuronidase
MPFLTRQRLSDLQTDTTMTSSKFENFRENFSDSEEGRINLAQLQLNPDIDRKVLTFSLETTGRLVGEEIYWLQIEMLWNNQPVWRGEVGVFRDETQPIIRFSGNIPLSEAQLWSLQEPNLYDLGLTLYRGTRFQHRVETFFGLSRVVTVDGPAYVVNNFGWEPAVEAPENLGAA